MWYIYVCHSTYVTSSGPLDSYLYIRYCENSKSLDDNRGLARVRRCHLLISFQESLEGDCGGIECDGATF